MKHTRLLLRSCAALSVAGFLLAIVLSFQYRADNRDLLDEALSSATVIADERVGYHHDLAGVAGVRADLLVARLRRVDHEIAAIGLGCPEADARERRAVLQRQETRSVAADAGVDDGIAQWSAGLDRYLDADMRQADFECFGSALDRVLCNQAIRAALARRITGLAT